VPGAFDDGEACVGQRTREVVAWLERHAPGHKDKVLGRIRELRGGKLYDSKFGARMRGEGPLASQIKALFTFARRQAGLDDSHFMDESELSTSSFRVPTAQMSLFEM